jgi:hypothetical protein
LHPIPLRTTACTFGKYAIARLFPHIEHPIYFSPNKTTSGNIFNIGASTLKQYKVCTAAPIDVNVPTTKIATLTWQAKTLNLVYYDGRKFSYQI